ncbi:MAG: RedB, partial [Planctomycetota bacterium]
LLMLFPAIILAGVCQLTAYSARPGSVGTVPLTLPPSIVAASTLGELPAEAKTLLVFYHPRCPCTRSTARNLARFAASFRNAVQIVAFGFQPNNTGSEWMDTDITRQFMSIEGCTVVPDLDAEMARSFDVHTSGHVLLYSHEGNLRFSGGITPSRGHEGESNSASQLVSLINSDELASLTASQWPCFGCRIYPDKEIMQ